MVATFLLSGCAFVAGVPDESASRGDPGTPPAAPPPAASVVSPRARPRVDLASYYAKWHHGRPTASGEAFDMDALTAAHRSLPLGACLEVVHLGNGRRVFVRVNDRGPYVPGRAIDVSYRAAQELGMLDDGVARVRIKETRSGACEGPLGEEPS
ncbi:MAG TPA: septal ring lytic transglycosylase RlpA family protein [Methylomirabilota bacterium]|nr:septal ring lytic transglycosylase RlpA family protein [Methylomirabilota bacterium]